MTTPYKIMIITSWFVIWVLAHRVYYLEQNIKNIKMWLKVCEVVDLDKLAEEYWEWKERASDG